MKLFRQMCFLLLVSGFIFGQSAPNNTNTDDSRISNQIKSLQDAIASQQQQIEQLRQELAARKQAESAPHLANATLTTGSSTNAMVQETEKPKESPLSFRIGGTDFTPGGFSRMQLPPCQFSQGRCLQFAARLFRKAPWCVRLQFSRWRIPVAIQTGSTWRTV